MFTFHQVQAMREHRYGQQGRDEAPKDSRRRHISLNGLVAALGSGLARIGTRDHEAKERPAY
jgi:hypothetical protein